MKKHHIEESHFFLSLDSRSRGWKEERTWAEMRETNSYKLSSNNKFIRTPSLFAFPTTSWNN